MSAKKILIIEDDPVLLRGLRDNLEASGYQVHTAKDGQQGLEALLNEAPDLMLLDLMLPKLDGYEICRRARQRRLTLPIIMLTARGQEDDIVRGLELGADDYVTKPFNIRELLARVKAFLRRQGAEPATYEFGKPVRPVPIDKLAVWSSCAGQRQTNPSPDRFGSLRVLAASKFFSSVRFISANLRSWIWRL